MQAVNSKLLKSDVFGRIILSENGDAATVVREAGSGPRWARWLARRLLRRESRALAALAGVTGIPALLAQDGDRLHREWIPGRPMHLARPADPQYFRHALRILRHMHARGVAHNDLAKEPNWLVTPAGRPALVDFQLAACAPRRGRLFRMLAREDLRHLLKHKRSYCPDRLTSREKAILSRPAVLSRAWRRGGKPVYLFVTRRLLGWSDREGAGDRAGPAGLGR